MRCKKFQWLKLKVQCVTVFKKPLVCIVLRVRTFMNVLMGSMLSVYQYKKHKSSRILHAGPWSGSDSLCVCAASWRAAAGPAQLHGDDALHQQGREPQADDEPAAGQEPQHPVRSLPRLQGSNSERGRFNEWEVERQVQWHQASLATHRYHISTEQVEYTHTCSLVQTDGRVLNEVITHYTTTLIYFPTDALLFEQHPSACFSRAWNTSFTALNNIAIYLHIKLVSVLWYWRVKIYIYIYIYTGTTQRIRISWEGCCISAIKLKRWIWHLI